MCCISWAYNHHHHHHHHHRHHHHLFYHLTRHTMLPACTRPNSLWQTLLQVVVLIVLVVLLLVVVVVVVAQQNTLYYYTSSNLTRETWVYSIEGSFYHYAREAVTRRSEPPLIVPPYNILLERNRAEWSFLRTEDNDDEAEDKYDDETKGFASVIAGTYDIIYENEVRVNVAENVPRTSK
ncbi:hypothetical protein HZH66_002701 [Vespula vulgaris]|uniref:Uncharacterized protein n=1 Tax=Vespula vulgaris TaxID=7454 RepID=A0A834KNL6_VESVU|nr:hypothetical protein HZH66_002701 [Vespula vulgaris]